MPYILLALLVVWMYEDKRIPLWGRWLAVIGGLLLAVLGTALLAHRGR